MSYDPTIGRWISEDPIGFQAADGNLYRYVGNDSTNEVDPSGLFPAPPPKTTQPKVPGVILGQDIIKGPLVGVYGSFIWPVSFSIKPKTTTGGWIIQQVKVTHKAYNGKDDVTTKIVAKGTDKDFWEA